ncbi:hypothetical protein SAMN05216371_4584 [Streptomyces sp. TLI_053]|uniref:hypothetical protein n=1 Tax=Streptomyces sp. TLI_053 TaxID=1855352 RepID=UPI00087A0333|nr:hypothetical protein [Streptomyces sp. TLI_053]SDT73859.1 hypothetical protein SAMN05216371_4584 [Streptomyces sp. TLI_053]
MTMFHGAAEDRAERYRLLDLVTGQRAGRVRLDPPVDRSLEPSAREAFLHD